jgi:dGTPase
MAHLAGRVAEEFEQQIREREAAWLSDHAVPSYGTAGRLHTEDDAPGEACEIEPGQRDMICSLRTPFQVDRDRILHSKAFRRLASKTQVFIAPEGDHYRTRLTHTLEVMAISRVVARALHLNEDLTEAVAVGHDLGHPPFGHTGEFALDAILQERWGRRFHHNEQSLRTVDVLERAGRGLNLTQEVRNGILCHTGDQIPDTLEARIVRIVDRVAYINHDIDDALRAGLLSWDDLPPGPIALLGDTGSQRIDRLVHDLIETSWEAGDIIQSDSIGQAMLDLRSFMFDNVYLTRANNEDKMRVEELLPRLVDHYIEHQHELPLCPRNDDLPQRITDFVAGMTDRYCLRMFRELFLPREWRF